MAKYEIGSLTSWGLITGKYGNEHISDNHVEDIRRYDKVEDIDFWIESKKRSYSTS